MRLPEPAWKIIQARRVSDSECPFVFESPKRANQAVAHVAKAVIRLRKRTTIAFSPHDLRRTAASLMAAAGVHEHVIPKVLGHVPEGVTRRTTTYYAYDQEKRQALNQWSDELNIIVTSSGRLKRMASRSSQRLDCGLVGRQDSLTPAVPIPPQMCRGS